MRVRKIVSTSAGTLMLVTNLAPILANEVSYMTTNVSMQISEDSIDDSAGIIQQYLDGIQINNVKPVQQDSIYDEVTYFQKPNVYNYVEEDIPAKQNMTVDECMALFESMMKEMPQESTEIVNVQVDYR